MSGTPSKLNLLPGVTYLRLRGKRYAGLEWLHIAWLDFPVSIRLVPLAWHYGYPLWWFGIIGTAWWYLLSWLLLTVIRGVFGWIRR